VHRVLDTHRDDGQRDDRDAPEAGGGISSEPADDRGRAEERAVSTGRLSLSVPRPEMIRRLSSSAHDEDEPDARSAPSKHVLQ
jgi:hypothetical protein